MIYNQDPSERITTALVLAAGTGSRLSPLTNDAPKCLTRVNEMEILGRLVESLHLYNFNRLVIVIGPFEQQIRDYLGKIAGHITVEFIISPLYKSTNNIYSLWMAKEKIKESFVLIESDLIFESSLLEEMLSPNKIAVSHTLPWMNGTTVSTEMLLSERVRSINLGDQSDIKGTTYKTVNIYSFSQPTWRLISKRLDSWISDGKVNDYYEAVFAEMVSNGSLDFQCVFFDNDKWYEVDTIEDLYACEEMLQISKGIEQIAI